MSSSTTTTDNNLPAETSTSMISLGAFVIVTLIYFIAKSYSGNSSSAIMTSIYFLAILITQGVVNCYISNEMCGTTQWSMAAKLTIFPWVLIFGSMYMMLTMFPVWKRPFANTLGYVVIKLLNLNKLLVGTSSAPGLFKSRIHVTSKTDNKTVAVADAINNIYSDPALVINEMTPENFDESIYKLKTGGMINSNNELIEKLRGLINVKDGVAELVWYTLTGMVAMAAGQNYLVSSQCSKSSSQLQTQTDNMFEQTAN